jgi:hypothetical protein
LGCIPSSIGWRPGRRIGPTVRSGSGSREGCTRIRGGWSEPESWLRWNGTVGE